MFIPKQCIKIATFTSNSRISSFTKIVPTIKLIFFFYRNTVLVIAFINFSTSIWVSPIPVFKRSVSSSKAFFKSKLISTINTFICNIEWKCTFHAFITYLVAFVMILSNKTFSELYFQNAFEYFIIVQYLLDVHLVKLIFLFIVILMVNHDVRSEESENQITTWLSDYCEIIIVILGWFRIVLQTVSIIFYSSVFILNTTRTIIVSWIYVDLNTLITNQVIEIVNYLSFFI